MCSAESTLFAQKVELLLIDDNPQLVESLSTLLSEFFEVSTASSSQEAFRLLDSRRFSLVILDVDLEESLDGVEVLSIIRSRSSVPVLMLTGSTSVATAVEAMKRGAADYVRKPFDPEDFIQRCKEITASERVAEYSERGTVATQVSPSEPVSERFYWGKTEKMRALKAKLSQLSKHEIPVTIVGESGTGKEMIARWIHRSGERSDGPFVVVACGALTPSLLESELFGHEAGAFTHALSARPGYFEVASGGTVYLDEVADLPQRAQSLLLRILQEQAVRRVGSNELLPVDVRIIASTRQPLKQLVESGRLRSDLAFRLNVFQVELPPLRERPEDLPGLFEVLRERNLSRFGRAGLRLREGEGGQQVRPTEAALEFFRNYSWPGNVRELENLICRALATEASPNLSKAWVREALSGVRVYSEHEVAVATGKLSISDAVTEYREQLERLLSKN